MWKRLCPFKHVGNNLHIKSNTDTSKDGQHINVNDENDTSDKEFPSHVSTPQKVKFECEECVNK